MGVLDSFGALVGSVIAAVVMLVFAIVSFYITVFIVDAGASFAGQDPSGDFVTLSAALLATGAIVAGGGVLPSISEAE